MESDRIKQDENESPARAVDLPVYERRVATAPGADAYCVACGAGMTQDEAALNLKYNGRHVRAYLCPVCLGAQLGMTAEKLRGMIAVFQRQGCRLFSPLRED